MHRSERSTQIGTVEYAVAVLGACCVLAIAACGPGTPTNEMSVLYDAADGSGTMLGSSDEPWKWQACPSCEPVDARMIGTGFARPGTVFVATAPDGEKARSPTWRGDLTPATPPRVRGRPRANAVVTPVPGTWRGGWDGSGNDTELAACWAPDGTGCTTLTNDHYDGCDNGRAMIDPVFTGRYLQVAIRRRPPGEATTAYLVSTPYFPQFKVAGPTVSVAVAGRIGAATGPPEAHCGPRPIQCPARVARATCIPAVTARISARGIGQVLCPKTTCQITLKGRRGEHKLRITRTIERGRIETIRLARDALNAVHGRRLRLRLFVQRQLLARRTVTVP